MSRIDFASLRSKHPELAAALDQLRQWLARHPGLRFFDANRVAKEIEGLSAADLLFALSTLAAEGELKLYYRVRPPNRGTFLEEAYTKIADIPHELRDAYQVPFTLDDAEIVPVFTAEEASGLR